MCIQHKLGILNIWEVKPCKFLTFVWETICIIQGFFFTSSNMNLFLISEMVHCLISCLFNIYLFYFCWFWDYVGFNIIPPPFKRPYTIFFLPESYSIILFRVPRHYYLFPGANILFLQGYLFNPIQQLNSKKVRSEQLWKKF